jgi:hypothetical protein
MARQYNLKPPPIADTPLPDDLNDESPFPFGKHKGEPMKDVPGSYLGWVWNTFEHKKHNSPLFRYIVKNIENIESDAPDMIFEPDPRKFRK